MLRKLTVENFYSIKDAQTLDLEIARNATDPDGRFVKPIDGSDKRYPKVVAIFGANASGKTNLLRALAFLAQFLQKSAAWPPDAGLSFLPFFGKGAERGKTKMFIEFDILMLDLGGRIEFRYELEVTSDGKRVIFEALRYYPQGHGRWLFRRNGNDVSAGKDFGLPERDPVRTKIRKNASVISMLAQFNHPFSTMIYQSLEGLQSNVDLLGKHELPAISATQYYCDVPFAFEKLNSEISRFDLGIERIELRPGKDGIQPWFYHEGLEGAIMLTFESHGTRRFYSEFSRLHRVLESGGVAVLDELDNDIHALLLPEIVRLFQNKEKNPRDAQLIMSCHNPALLEYLEKEEIYFTEKDGSGKTQIYGLQDIKGVRRDTNVYAKYLAGAFGAVPRVA